MEAQLNAAGIICVYHIHFDAHRAYMRQKPELIINIYHTNVSPNVPEIFIAKACMQPTDHIVTFSGIASERPSIGRSMTMDAHWYWIFT